MLLIERMEESVRRVSDRFEVGAGKGSVQGMIGRKVAP